MSISTMYLGRLLIIGPDIAAYRVSSRSFPNRRLIRRAQTTYTVEPTDEAPETDNPYVSYNCLRLDPDTPRAVLGNGSHVDPIFEKLTRGHPPRDAAITGLFALDYERDEYNTPRIAGVITPETAVIGIIRQDALIVQTVTTPHLVATYERTSPTPFTFEMADGETAAQAAYDLDFEHPVAAVGLAVDDAGVDVGICNNSDKG